MKTISFRVSDEVADIINNMDDNRRNELLQSLENWVRPKRSLEEIMNDMSKQAKRNGLTPEMLDDLLKDE
ncbi:MAG: hypothetical protein GVY19_03825 [Bacteroidetes bacterium]|jgi:flagellar motor switch protein FliG|nr:hypothetical protein [Bacteroidota bacterium]